MCPAAGYAFFGGARGPRPTGRYVEPRVGDGVPTFRQRGSAALGDGFPRQSADWLGMTGFFDRLTSLSEGGEGRRIPTPVFALARNDRERADRVVRPYETGHRGCRGRRYSLSATSMVMRAVMPHSGWGSPRYTGTSIRQGRHG